MDPSTPMSSCSRNPARAPDVTGMEQVLSDLQALQGLYGLLHPGHQANENLDEASRALLMKMLDNATQQTLLKQAKMLSDPLMSPALERKLSIQPGGDAEQRLKTIASPSLSLQASVRSRRINRESSVKSRDYRHVYDDQRRREKDDHLLARVASNRSSRTAMPPRLPSTPEQRLARVASNRSSRTAMPPRLPSTPEQRLARLSSHCSSRTAMQPRLPSTPEQRLARLSSHFSSRTAMPPRLPSTPEQRLARLSSHRSSRATEPWRGVASGSASHASRSGRHSRLRRGSGRGDRSSSSPSPSPECSSSSSSSRGRSVSRALSTARLHGRATAQGLGAGSSSAHRRIGRQDSRLSMGGVTSRRGSERAAGRGAATPSRLSSSSDGKAVTIRSRIRPNRELLDRCVRRAEELEELSLRHGGKKDSTVRSGVSMARSSARSMGRSSHRPRRALDPIDSGSTYSSGSSSPPPSPSIRSPSTIPTAPSTPSASASHFSSSVSVSVSPRASARPEHAFEEASNTSRNRRRRERQERREGRLQRFKNKLALVFHHHHDHHHHHHIGQGGRSGSPLPKKDLRGKSKTSKSPWSYLGGMFHHRTAGDDGGKKKEKKSTSKTVVTAKQRGGGGHAQSLFDALVKHKLGGRKAPVPARRAGMVRTRSLSRVQVKKINWWQQLRQRRGKAEVKGKPRRRLGQGKKAK